MNRAAAPSDALLESYVQGELDPVRAQEIRSGEIRDAALRARIEALRASDAEILQAYPVAAMAAAIRSRRIAPASNGAASRASAPALASRPAAAATAPSPAPAAGTPSPLSLIAELRNRLSPTPGFRFAAPLFALLAIGLFLILHADWKRSRAGSGQGNTQVALAEPGGGQDPEGGIRLKGAEAGLAIFRKTASGSELLPPRTSARPGDTLQVFYHSRIAQYGIVFSVDGAGSLTLHYPEAEGPAAALRVGDMLPLPHSFRLDNAPRYERFFLVTSREPFRGDSLLSRLRGHMPASALPADTLAGLEAGFRQYPYTIHKSETGARRLRKESGK